MKRTMVTGLLVSSCSLQAMAQSSLVRDHFAIPTTLRICHSLPAQEPDSGFSALQMIEDGIDSLPGRSFLLRFDSAGVIYGVAVFGSERTSANDIKSFATTAKIVGERQGYRVRLPDSVSVAGSDSSLKKVPLTEEELQRAAAVAKWLWSRRCYRAPGSPG